jgi:hypothetical protein
VLHPTCGVVRVPFNTPSRTAYPTGTPSTTEYDGNEYAALPVNVSVFI